MTLTLMFTLMVLCAYRATRLITRDSLFDRPRERWFDRFPYDGERGKVSVDWSKWSERLSDGAYMTPRAEPRPVSHWGELVRCPWCCGFYLACAVVGAVWYVHSLPLPALWFGAVPCAAGFLGEIDTALSGVHGG